MSKITLVCVGNKCYNNSKVEQQSIIRNYMVKYIKEFEQLGCSFSYVAHDHIAHLLLSELGIKDKECVDIIPTVEFNCWSKYFRDDSSNITDEVPTRADRRIDYDNSFYKYPKASTFTDKSEYLKERKKAMNKNIKTAMGKFIENSPIVLYFANDSEICSKPSASTYSGDGKIIIEVDCLTGIVNSYYGGMWVDFETIKSIIEMEA